MRTMKLLPIIMLVASTVLADQEACITVFEAKPCRAFETIEKKGRGILIPARFGHWRRVLDEYGVPLTERGGIVRRKQSYFWWVAHGRKVPKIVVAEREDAVCVFKRKR